MIFKEESPINPHILSLTSLRFIAAMCVFGCHLIATLADPSLFPLVLRLSSFGMTTFFVLSGFVIHWNYHDHFKKKSDVFNYIIARIARVYPLYIVFVFFSLFRVENAHEYMSSLPYYLTLTQSWFPLPTAFDSSHFLGRSLMAVFWSLSAEMLLYFLYIFISPFFIYLKDKTKLGIIFLCMILLSYGAFYFWIDFIGPLTGTLSFWFSDCLLRLPEFLMGCFVSQYILIKGFEELRWVKIGLVLFSLSYLSIALSYCIFSAFLLSPAIAVLIYLLCINKNTIIKKIFENKYAILLGDASYSIYLFHFIFLGFMQKMNGVSFFLRAPLLILFVLLISLCVYKGFEAPLRKIIRKKFSIHPESARYHRFLNTSPLDTQVGKQ